MAFAQQAVALDPRSWRGHGHPRPQPAPPGRHRGGPQEPRGLLRGRSLQRLDQEHARPPRHASRSTRRRRRRTSRILLHGKESELLAPYVAELAEEAYARLAERYRLPSGRAHPHRGLSRATRDFSVRTVGLAGLAGARRLLRPRARHRLALRARGRPVQLGLDALARAGPHRHARARRATSVPRWFGEGLSVHEERRARPGLGRRRDRSSSCAPCRPDELLPLRRRSTTASCGRRAPSRWRSRTTRPRWSWSGSRPQRGFPAILELLKAYGEGRTTEQAFAKVLGTTLEDFDRAFFAHLQQRFAGPLAAIRRRPKPSSSPSARHPAAARARGRRAGHFEAQIAAGLASFHESKRAEALPYLERARGAVPRVRREGQPALLPGRDLQGAGQDGRRRSPSSRAHRHQREPLPRAPRAGARCCEEQGDLGGRGRRRSIARSTSGPSSPAVHERLAAPLHAAGRPRAGRARAPRRWSPSIPSTGRRRSTSSRWPCSRPGTPTAARREVLRALEMAPRFQRAQELLLRLHDARAGSTSR